MFHGKTAIRDRDHAALAHTRDFPDKTELPMMVTHVLQDRVRKGEIELLIPKGQRLIRLDLDKMHGGIQRLQT